MEKDSILLWLTIGLYVAALVIIAVVTGRKSKSIADFTVGGRNAGAWLSALSYGTAYFSAVMFVGYAGGTGLSFGLWGILAGIGNAVFGSLLAWLVLARRTRDVSARLKIKTMPQFFEIRYGSKAMKTFVAIVIFVFLVPYSASVYNGLASVADVLLGINVEIFLIIIAILALLLVVFGGYLVQARADFVQGIIMMIGVTLLIIFVIRCDKVGGLEGLAEYAHSESGLPKLNTNQWISLWATVLMTSFGTWGLPQMIQKYFGIKDDKQAKRGIVISTLFAFLIAGGGYFIGSLCHRFFTAETMPVKDYIVPEMLKMAQLPVILLGVIIVLLLSASVSTLCSITISASSAATVDLLFEKKQFSEKKKSVLIKAAAALFILLSYVVAKTDTPILEMMSYSWGIISGSFLAPYVLALYCKWLNKIGAWAGILSGFLIALVPAVSRMIVLCGGTADVIVNFSKQGPLFACIAMLVSIAFCLIFSAATKNRVEENTNSFYNK